MTVIRPVPVTSATLEILAGQNAQTQAVQTPAAIGRPLPAQTGAQISQVDERKAMLFAVLQQALGAAAPRQGGLSPLMANVQTLLAQGAPGLPSSVEDALRALLATALDAPEGVSAGKLQQAVRQSGAFLESTLANGQPVPGDMKAAMLGLRQALQTWLGGSGEAGSAPRAQPQSALVPPVRDAALQLLAQAEAALARQTLQPLPGQPPLQNGLAALLGRQDASLPQDVRAAMQAVLAQRPAQPTGDALKLQAALQQSGLLSGQMAPTQNLPADLKSALLNLRQALQGWLGVKAGASAPQNPAQPTVLPPPYRDAPTVPQAPVPGGALEGLPLREAGLRLLADTDAALARHTLLQIASLPPDEAARNSDPAQRLVFDIPLATPQGTAIMQLRIEREETRAGGEQKKRGWLATFSVDVEPIGPVHARVAVAGEITHVSLFAERSESARALREGLPMLEAGLHEAALAPGEILCAAGSPAQPAAAPGLFVDRAS